MKIKCNARVFVYQVGDKVEKLEYHPGCDGFPFETLNETFGKQEGFEQFGETAVLVEMRDEVHYIEKNKPKAKGR